MLPFVAHCSIELLCVALCDLVWSCVFFCGLRLLFLALIDPNSFGLISIKNIYDTQTSTYLFVL